MASGAAPRDYKARYPPDPYGQEMSENARIWPIYLEEAAEFDANMLAEWRDTIDVLLVFVRLTFPLKIKLQKVQCHRRLVFSPRY